MKIVKAPYIHVGKLGYLPLMLAIAVVRMAKLITSRYYRLESWVITEKGQKLASRESQAKALGGLQLGLGGSWGSELRN
ncbi:hypothetical protein QBC44DRAFT_371916 [Cladorrhinum sp. PSN332]|nr:hypothetical protein QBC44DRAFT_371916 [Cladorrhinum sp. PSN332]